jgi:hypothetical protein
MVTFRSMEHNVAHHHSGTKSDRASLQLLNACAQQSMTLPHDHDGYQVDSNPRFCTRLLAANESPERYAHPYGATRSRVRDEDVDDRILGANAIRQYLPVYMCCHDSLIAYIGPHDSNLRLTPRGHEYIHCDLKKNFFIHYNKEMCFHNCRNGYDAMEYVSTWVV